MKKISVGLAGGIGSGKSTVASLLENYGAEIVSGDELGREVVENDPSVKVEIQRVLGDTVLRPDGSFDRGRIAQRVFAEQRMIDWLTKLTFPAIHMRWLSAFQSSNSRVIVFDAALIFEWGIEREFDLTIGVLADHELVISRIGEKFSRDDILRRMSLQASMIGKIMFADVLIENNDSRENLMRQVERVWYDNILPLTA